MARRSFPTAAQVRAKGFPDTWRLQFIASEAVSVSPCSGFSSRGCWRHGRSGLSQAAFPQAAQGVF